MTMQGRHRVALVTGGGSGIGFAIVTRLLDAGFSVGFFGRDQSRIAEAEVLLEKRFTRARFLGGTADVNSRASIEETKLRIRERFGFIDTLVCSAGISPKGSDGATPFSMLSLDEWNQVLSTNLTGSMLCCQAVLSDMMEKRFGRIVLIGSIAGRTAPKLAGTAYAASKAGLAGLARSLVTAASGTGVTVNTIAPGHIATSMIGDLSTPGNDAALRRIPAGRIGTPEDVASATAFLVSEEASFVNGAIIDVNGGELTPP